MILKFSSDIIYNLLYILLFIKNLKALNQISEQIDYNNLIYFENYFLFCFFNIINI